MRWERHDQCRRCGYHEWLMDEVCSACGEILNEEDTTCIVVRKKWSGTWYLPWTWTSFIWERHPLDRKP